MSVNVMWAKVTAVGMKTGRFIQEIADILARHGGSYL